MADTIRGDGLFTANNALAALVEDPQRLDRARARFSESPPSYRSVLSQNSTLPHSPDPPRDEQQDRDERKWKLIREHRASLPGKQYEDQTSQELNLLFNDRDRERNVPIGINFFDYVDEMVKERWVKQGIWNEKWKPPQLGRWKHEEPLEPETESDADQEAGAEVNIFSFCPQKTESKPRRPKSAEELQQIAESRRVRELEREASRPYHQFLYQVSEERGRIQNEIGPLGPQPMSELNPTRSNHHEAALQVTARHGGAPREPAVQNSTVSTPPHINTTAYETVKGTWMKRGIWNKKWGVLPGMSWKHEQNVDEMLREEMGDDPVPREVVAVEERQETRELPRIFGTSPRPEDQPTSNDSHELDHPASPSPAAASGHVLCGMDAPSQEPWSGNGPSGLLNGDTSQSSTASNSARYHAESQEASRSTLRSRGRRGERESSVEAGPASQTPRTTLGPVRPSKVSKPRRKNGVGTREPPDASELTEVQKPVPGPDIASPPLVDAPVQPRRSRRLQGIERKAGADSSTRGISSSTPKIPGPGKPRGVAKRRSGRIRRKAN